MSLRVELFDTSPAEPPSTALNLEKEALVKAWESSGSTYLGPEGLASVIQAQRQVKPPVIAELGQMAVA